jgi:hypothetical protein
MADGRVYSRCGFIKKLSEITVSFIKDCTCDKFGHRPSAIDHRPSKQIKEFNNLKIWNFGLQAFTLYFKVLLYELRKPTIG